MKIINKNSLKIKDDTVENRAGTIIQHGKLNDRIYLMELGAGNEQDIILGLEELAYKQQYSKIFAKIPANRKDVFLNHDFILEAKIPQMFKQKTDGLFLSKYLDISRGKESPDRIAIMKSVLEKAKNALPAETEVRKMAPVPIISANKQHCAALSSIYKKVFATYPFPIHDENFILETMNEETRYFFIEDEGKIAATASYEMNQNQGYAEMTDFATLPDYRGRGYAQLLLTKMEEKAKDEGISCAFTIARALSYGMNITFSRLGYTYGGTMIKNTNISGSLESMNVWYKQL